MCEVVSRPTILPFISPFSDITKPALVLDEINTTVEQYHTVTRPGYTVSDTSGGVVDVLFIGTYDTRK